MMKQHRYSLLPYLLLVTFVHLGLAFLGPFSTRDRLIEHSLRLKLIGANLSAEATTTKKNPLNIAQPLKSSLNPKAELSSTKELSSDSSIVAVDGKMTNDLKIIYTTKLRTLIEANQFYPTMARELGQTGIVHVSFNVVPSGVIDNVRLIKSSGYKKLDTAAMELISSVSGKLPMPKELNLSHLQLEMPVHYELD